jgi:hypothetical protein
VKTVDVLHHEFLHYQYISSKELIETISLHDVNLLIPKAFMYVIILYEGPLQSSWIHLITPSRKFVKVR